MILFIRLGSKIDTNLCHSLVDHESLAPADTDQLGCSNANKTKGIAADCEGDETPVLPIAPGKNHTSDRHASKGSGILVISPAKSLLDSGESPYPKLTIVYAVA